MTGLAAGPTYLARGFSLWRTRPRLMLLGMLPAVIVFLVLFAALVALLLLVDDLVEWATPFAEGWGTTPRTVLRLGLMVAVLAAAVFVAVVAFVALTLTVGDPFYQRIWRETEAMLGGPVPDGGVGAWRSVRDSAAFVGTSLLAGVGVLLAGLVPFVGPVLGAGLGLVVSGRLLAAELVARPLEARGLDRAARAALLAPHRTRVLGFGVATQACFLVPLGAVVVMPAAVVGSTILARDVLADQRPLSV